MADKQCANAWKKYKIKMKNKRTGRKKENTGKPVSNELTVQRLSQDVAGKAQKYLRMGPRRGVGTGQAKAPPTLKITQKVPFSFEVKCPFSLGKRFLNKL